MSKTVDKVVAFITGRNSVDAKMLVIRHPITGVQIPAGTVELGETAEEAVRREIEEETGITNCRLIARLGSMSHTTADNERVVLRMTKLFDRPANDASSEGFALTRGSYITVEGVIGSFSEVTGEPLDMRESPPSRTVSVRGYVRSSLLGRSVNYHFYHFTSAVQTGSEWLVRSDGVEFSVFWIPLVPRPIFNPIQEAWMDSVYSKLINYYQNNGR